MLGWWIVISTLSPEEMDIPRDNTATLAHWEVSIGGIDWLDQLTRQGKAQQLRKDGYPSRWQARAEVILPLLEKGKLYVEYSNPEPPISSMDEGEEYVRPKRVHWFDEITQYPDRIAACNSEQMLTIDVWDLS
ncbi:hypothetical protein AXE65_09230 [Ventosimonas gracilis]|uniref:Uncharacterized protein n=1 Tax=Ventosimonas gracilis TaxID=1680762 RepID=A0A139SXD8_9GAMM|nr:hypothetical protein [Ventosimonas gracilis]KXU39249.1 hypothetical protein AXE65_09230 [Ventosimonas gracilis]